MVLKESLFSKTKLKAKSCLILLSVPSPNLSFCVFSLVSWHYINRLLKNSEKLLALIGDDDLLCCMTSYVSVMWFCFFLISHFLWIRSNLPSSFCRHSLKIHSVQGIRTLERCLETLQEIVGKTC